MKPVMWTMLIILAIGVDAHSLKGIYPQQLFNHVDEAYAEQHNLKNVRELQPRYQYKMAPAVKYNFFDKSLHVHDARRAEEVPASAKYSVAIGAVFKNEAAILDEWLQHYIAEGVEHFYLVNDHSTDTYLDVLSKYGSNLVTLYDKSRPHSQVYNYQKFLRRAKAQSIWLALLDLDEFVSTFPIFMIFAH
jgi:hypothetical protein